MVYAILGAMLGGFGAVVSLLFGAPVLTALAIYIGTGMLSLVFGLGLAALCLWRHPHRDDALLIEARR